MLNKVDRNKNPFQVPENYFENFNAEIMNKLPEKANMPSVKKISLWKKVLPWTAVAAILCGVILNWNKISEAVYQPANVAETDVLPEKSSINQQGLASLSEEDFYQYVEDQVTASAMKEMLSADY